MHFRLDDGKPVWAIATTQITVDNESVTIELYDPAELENYPDYVPLDPPTPELLGRAAEIKGRTFSKTEFEQLLTAKTPDELLKEQNAAILLANAKQAVALQALQAQNAHILLAVAQLQAGGDGK